MAQNVLIIDDTQSDHHLCVECLGGESEHYHFLHAYSGAEGLKLYQSHAIDCILLDYNLPDMNGLDVLKKFGDAEKIVPVIMMTGEGNELIAVTAMKLGSQDYIPKKAVTSSALRRAIGRTLKHIELLKKMEQYRADLERSNCDLELFANIVAHDLKSPLRAITQHLTLIKNKIAGKLDGNALRSLEFAVDGAERMHVLIDTLFTYAKLGFSELEFDRIDMQAVLGSVQRDLYVSIEESRACITNDPLPLVKGSSSLLSQLLQNLIGNAIKYCKGPPRIHISATPEGNHWRISVRDNGIGIPPAQHEKIFAIFRRLHSQEEYPGIGLGLAVCYRIVKRHGGKIWVESGSGSGSVFHFTLPVAETVSQRKVSHG
jgi:light-regulated signal transduction histidine kinase (bacteriophytochrome)